MIYVHHQILISIGARHWWALFTAGSIQFSGGKYQYFAVIRIRMLSARQSVYNQASSFAANHNSMIRILVHWDTSLLVSVFDDNVGGRDSATCHGGTIINAYADPALA